MRVGVYQNTEKDERVVAALSAFKEGLTHLGVDWFEGGSSYRQPCDVAVIWGITSTRAPHTNYRDMIRMARRNTIVLERGFVKRDEYFAAGWGDTAGYADFCNENSPNDRWEKLGLEVKPNRPYENGEYTLVCGQIPWDTAVQHIDYPKWLGDVVTTLKKADVPLRFRNHPLLPQKKRFRFPGVITSVRSLEEDLADASQVVACNSTTLVDATVLGIPTISADGRAMDPPMGFDRYQWANNIAYAQWTLDEFRRGLAFEHLIKGRGL